ncbi:MAG TPA: ABC transporter permease [Pseudonocardiaceae bacterium]|nr:ABC transporter permease [Pseudonocardiaceae bacterium]
MSTTIVDEGTPAAGALPPTGLPTDIKVTLPRLLRSEWVKFWSLRSSYFTLAGTVVAMIGLGALISFFTENRWAQIDPAERFHFNPTGVSLHGWAIAQLVVGVLGIMVITGEYGTGMIRSSLAAAPKRIPVLVAKSAVFAAIAFVVTTAAAIVAFLIGQALLSPIHINTTLSAPGVLRTVIGVGLYITVVGLLGVGLGFIIRNTAGTIATLFGILLVLPVLVDALPTTWSEHISPYLPSNAGQEILTLHTDPGMLAPWTGFGVFCIYAAVALIVGGFLLRRRDA